MRSTRWLVPIAVLAAVSGVAGVRASAAGAAPALPSITPAALLVKVSQAKVESLSGVVQSSTNLGLPSLPDTGGALSPQALLAGQHTLRVYLDGPERQRVDLLGTLAETGAVHNGRDVWQWSSSTNKATHSTLPTDASARPQAGKPEAGTPQALAHELLAAIDPTTTVSVGTAATVAGRSAYDLRLAPKSSDSLIRRADLYVDARTGLPLRVTILARGSAQPSVDVGYTAIDLRAPAARVFRFTPPPGAKVTQLPLPAAPAAGRNTGHQVADRATHGARPTVLGSGWTAVAELRTGGGMLGTSGQLGMLMRGAAHLDGRVPGRVIQTHLLTVLIADDGRIFAGAVTKAALLKAASSAG